MAADGDYAPYHNHTENSHQKREDGTEEKTPPFSLFQTFFIRQNGVLCGHGSLLHLLGGGQQAGHVIHGSDGSRKVVSVLLINLHSLLFEEGTLSVFLLVLQLERRRRRMRQKLSKA